MSRYRYGRAALAASACAATLSLAACSAGITTARSPAPPSAAPSHRVSSSPSPSHSPSSTPSEVRVNAPIHAFPIPSGAQVLANDSCPKSVSLIINPVAPARASAFYTASLPRAGYKITSNMSMSEPGSGKPMVEMEFTGHGYNGSLIAMADLSSVPSSGPSSNPVSSGLSGAMSKNVVEFTMSPPGVPDTYTCPGL